MPIYEYECKDCGHRIEAIQKMSDDPLSDCPECGKPDLKKLMSASGFRLKGSGWYETDFKSGKKKNLAQSDSTKSDTASDNKSDSNTGKKADNKSDKKQKPENASASKAKKGKASGST